MENMSPIERFVWCREFETGIAEIDLQHHNLVKMFNKANAELLEDSNRIVWENVTHEFHGYLLYHFWTEEDLAARYGYGQEKSAEASAHFEQHRLFTEEIVKIRKQIRSGEKVSKAEYIGLIRDWLSNHITDNDQWLIAFILEKQRLARQK